MKTIISTALWLCLNTIAYADQTNQTECLAQIMYSEARGQSLEGVVALGEAAKTRALNTETSTCRTKGVTRRAPPKSLLEYYKALASKILSTKSSPVAQGADSWNTGKKPAYPGKVTRVIDEHVFYVMKAPTE